jgi:L-amino acid N-acyltransferase
MVLIRIAEASDVPAITEISNALLASTTHEWTETSHTQDERTRWLRDQQEMGDPVFVAVDGEIDGGEVVGWAAYGDFRDSKRWPGYRFTVEHSVHVAESHWGRGIGRELLLALTEHARRAGKRVMVAAVDSSNAGSIAFHDRIGFDEVGRLPGIGEKWGVRLDLVLMQYDLNQPIP